MFSPVTTQLAREDRAGRLVAQAERTRLIRAAAARRANLAGRVTRRQRQRRGEALAPAPAAC